MGRPADAIPDAPVYRATMAEMDNLEELLATANQLAMRYGAVRIDPPTEWPHPPLRMGPKSRFFVRMQTLPAAPFVDPELVRQPNAAKPHPRKRTRRKPNAADEDSDEPLLVTKDTKTANLERAARAASRSQRIHPHRSCPDYKTLSDHIVKADFATDRTAPNLSLKLPPNPACTPATSPPPEFLASVPTALIRSEDKPILPKSMGQTSTAPAFSPASALQLQPSTSSTGQPEPAEEAAQRLAEAFTGSAKAGPAPNATAIPPCPFSQQTAREHIAKRTAEDRSSFPLIDTLPLPQAAPGAATVGVVQHANTRSHFGSGRGSEERLIRPGDAAHSHCGVEANRMPSDVGEERNWQNSWARRIDTLALPLEKERRHEGYLNSSAAQTTADMQECTTGGLQSKNSGAKDRVTHSNTQRPQITTSSSLAFYGPQPKPSPVITTHLKPTGGTVATTTIPFATKPLETPYDKDQSDRTHQGSQRPAPFLPFQASKRSFPNDFVPVGKINDNGAKNRSQGQRRTWTAVPTPIREYNVTALGQGNTSARPFIRSFPHPVHGIQPYAARPENIFYPPAISSQPNPARIQGGHRLQRLETTATGAIPYYSLLPPSSHKPKVPVFPDRPSLMKADVEKPPQPNSGLVKMPYGQPMKTGDIREWLQAGGRVMTEPLLSAACQRQEQKRDILDDKRPRAINAAERHEFNDERSAEKGSKVKAVQEVGLNVGGSYYAPESHVTQNSKHRPDQLKQIFFTASAMTPCQNVNMGRNVLQIGGPGSLNENLTHKLPPSNSHHAAELGFEDQSKVSLSIPALHSGHQKSTCDPGFLRSTDLSCVRREFASGVGREFVEEMLTFAMRRADATSMKISSEQCQETEIPTEDTTKHPRTRQPSFITESSASCRGDVMQIDSILSYTPLEITQGKEKYQRAQTSEVHQEQNTFHSKVPGLSPHTGVPNVGGLGPNQNQDASQKEQTTFNEPTIDAVHSIVKKQEELPLSRYLGKPELLPQQHTHTPQLQGGSAKAEEVVIVTEKRATPRRGRPSGNTLNPVPVINVDAPNTIGEKSNDRSHAKPQTKRAPKRRVENRFSHFDQDDAGRLTKAIVFPDSGTPVSLADYVKQAHDHHEETKKALNPCTVGEPDTDKAESLISKTDLHNVDTLEEEFWKAMTAGIRGKPITVAYGVDVEAEGAFDSTEMSYVEWHGAEITGKKLQKKKKERPRRQKGPNTARRPRSSEHIPMKSIDETAGSCVHDPHNDADDEMEYDDDEDKSLGTIAARKRMLHVRKQKLTEAEGKLQRDKIVGPRSHVGTLNRDGLLRHMPRMPGINHSMYYVGQLFTRFCWHTEDAFLNSVSYLHPGSAEKVWYAVPPQYAPDFEKYAAANVFSPEILENETTGQALLMNKTTMFDPRRVRRRGVEVFRVVHKPGSFVLTAARAYHAGFNCGFNIAEAVNFANPTWFPVGLEASAFARRTLKPLCVPWEYLLFHEAKAMRDTGHGAIARGTSAERLIGNARVVAKELKSIIMDGEMKIRKYAEKSNCRISMLHQVDGLAKFNQVGPEFGNGAGMVCSLCTHTCHFYAEMCGSCDDSFEARCVDHFGEGHRLCLQKTHKTVVVRRHDPVLLLDILGCLERIAGIEVDPAEQSRRYLGYLRTWQTPLKSSGLRLKLDLKAAASRLPPKVSKEKGSREKTVREKVIRSKATTRDKRRKIRKPRGMFPQADVKSKRGMFPQVGILGDVELVTSRGAQNEMRNQEEHKLEDVAELANRIPSLQ